MASPTLTARWELPSLLTALQHAGWGPLAERDMQGVRAVLVGLIGKLDHRSGAGMVTVAQVADATGGLSTKWVGRCMHVLEDLGLIEWRRGGVLAGKPQPSYVAISKRAVVALIKAARPMLAAVREARRVMTEARLAGISYLQGRSRRSDHVELSGDLPTPSGEVSTSPPRNAPPNTSPCSHGEPRGPQACPLCRRGIPA